MAASKATVLAIADALIGLVPAENVLPLAVKLATVEGNASFRATTRALEAELRRRGYT